jgi:hypothetical protein
MVPNLETAILRDKGFDVRRLGFFTTGVGAVTEPSTWAMMILGFAVIGAITHRRRKSTMLAA